MPTLITRFNWGTEIKNINPTLYNQLNDSFTTIANNSNTKPSRNLTTSDPPADSDINKSYVEGDFWVNKSTDTAWIMTSRSSNTAVT